ncbi:HAMP domain-containing histidine kinase [Candidatus Azambacteria bacterium]|nr:HAMP domain-containing histidine kinase [Candidatus Azambacteria bacterium]
MSFLDKLNLAKQCKEEFNVPVRKCPIFLFVLMGVIVITSVLTSYVVAINYSSDPEIGALTSLVTAGIILVLGYIIIQSFTRVVEVDRLKSQFLNIISHQLLTPLTSLKWSVNMMESETIKPDKEKLEEVFEMIKENSNKMIHIVNSLIDVSRIESGKVRITPQAMDIAKVVREAIVLRKGDLESRGHTMEFKEERNVPQVYGDPVRMRTAIESLIDNAIKYSTPHSVIFVALWKEGDSVLFEIKDTGVGIPKKEHKHVFGKFFRSAKDISLQTKGLGVGLFLVKFIIEASGGKVDFESQEGVGSKFWFSLPVYKT